MIALEPVQCGPRSAGSVAALRSFPERRFSICGMSIAAIHEPGREHPVVFLHGNSSTKDVWVNQIAFMRRHGRAVLAPDLPGHGRSDDSPTPEATYCLPGYARTIGALLDAVGWDCVDLVGWSLGGHIGLELLATDPRVASLLIVGTPPARPCGEALAQAFYRSDDMSLAGKPDFTAADALAYGTAMMGGPQHLSEDLLAHVRRTDGRARSHLFASVNNCMGEDHLSLVVQSKKPLCIVHGEQEPFVRLDYLRSIEYRALWNRRIYLILRAGHAPHWQAPDAFNMILFKFLNDVAAPDAMAHAS